jgi:hypothetical protein
MAGRRISNEQEARRCLGAARSASGGLAEWARSHGIDGRSLNAWRVNLERRRAPRPRVVAPKVVELVPVPIAAAVSSARYVLHVGGVGLELGDDFNEQTLRRLVGLLRSC